MGLTGQHSACAPSRIRTQVLLSSSPGLVPTLPGCVSAQDQMNPKLIWNETSWGAWCSARGCTLPVPDWGFSIRPEPEKGTGWGDLAAFPGGSPAVAPCPSWPRSALLSCRGSVLKVSEESGSLRFSESPTQGSPSQVSGSDSFPSKALTLLQRSF